MSIAKQLLEEHLVEGRLVPGEEVHLKVDQTLTQDATGTLVMLELEAMGLKRTRAEVSAQYVDHNVLQQDHRNPDDHLFLQQACEQFGIWYSPPGNGVSHVVHQECFGIPGKLLVGSDSHTPAEGAIGMLALGAGGLDVALAIAGQPVPLKTPRIRGIRLEGELPPWVSAKDVVLELLRRHSVSWARGWILEYFGPGLDHLEVMDRHVIANMGTELGATTSVFPSDSKVRAFLRDQGRQWQWRELKGDPREFEQIETVDLSRLESLIACPSSPDNVVPVREVAGKPIYQSYVGSSANPGFRDFAISAAMLAGERVHPNVSFDVSPTSRAVLLQLLETGYLGEFVRAGARIHQAGCNGCIGMGQAPATDLPSLRTVPRNFPGRSGTREDKVYLVSPETATASAITGRITAPQELGKSVPVLRRPNRRLSYRGIVIPPKSESARPAEIRKGPNIVALPVFGNLPDELEVPILLRVGDDLSTDEILPAGARVLPFRSNIPRISEFCFDRVDPSYAERASGYPLHAVVGGLNYGQGSSREHAAIAPRYLGLILVVARSFARIHWQNLVNYGILPLEWPGEVPPFATQGSFIRLRDIHRQLPTGVIEAEVNGRPVRLSHGLSPRQQEIMREGGLINVVRRAIERQQVA